MNRADMQMMLGQADELGNTLMKNRVLKQQNDERNQLVDQRNRFQTQDVGLRQQQIDNQAKEHSDNTTMVGNARSDEADTKTLSAGIQANMTGQFDDASREQFNGWLASHPKFNGLRVVAPPQVQKGTMETSQTRNFSQLQKLQQQIAAATTPEQKQQAEDQLATFKQLLPNASAPEDTETVSVTYDKVPGSEAVPEQSATRGIFGLGAKPAVPAVPAVPAQPERHVTYKQPRGGAKPLDKAKAAKLLDQAGGDKAKARALAIKGGYSIPQAGGQ